MEPQVSNSLALTAVTAGAKDTVTVYGWKALAGSVIGYAMDGFDMLILGFRLDLRPRYLRDSRRKKRSKHFW